MNIIEPLWYTRVCDIPPALSSYNDDQLFVILETIDIDRLISQLKCGSRELYNGDTSLYPFNQGKSSKIEGWIQGGNRLVPPLISYDTNADGLILEDGRHRLKAAIDLSQTHMPFMIDIRSYAQIMACGLQQLRRV